VVNRYRSGVTSYVQPGTAVTDHVFAAPLDHGRPGGAEIEVFAREIVAAGHQDAALPSAGSAPSATCRSRRTACARRC